MSQAKCNQFTKRCNRLQCIPGAYKFKFQNSQNCNFVFLGKPLFPNFLSAITHSFLIQITSHKAQNSSFFSFFSVIFIWWRLYFFVFFLNRWRTPGLVLTWWLYLLAVRLLGIQGIRSVFLLGMLMAIRFCFLFIEFFHLFIVFFSVSERACQKCYGLKYVYLVQGWILSEIF